MYNYFSYKKRRLEMRKITKKFLGLLLTGTMILSMVACGSGSAEDETTA